MDRPPGPDDTARIGVIDLGGSGKFEQVAETQAFNWQQGTHLQWLPGGNERRIIYNVRDGDHYAACIHDLEKSDRQLLPLPIYAISRDGKQALSLNFSRIHDCRPGYGYNGIQDPWHAELHPDTDGIYHMDLETGSNELIVSFAEIAAIRPSNTMEREKHWFNHLQFSTDDSRILFLHRWHVRHRPALTLARLKKLFSPRTVRNKVAGLRDGGARGRAHRTRMYTAAADGTDVYLLDDSGMTSHFDWRDPTHILAWTRRPGTGDHYYLLTDQSNAVEVVGKGLLDSDGHCSYSPDRRLVLTDTYPRGPHQIRTLIIYDPATATRTDVAAFHSLPDFRGEIRCDLHPRWNRDGTRVCLDSMHEGTRQIYEVDVAGIAAP